MSAPSADIPLPWGTIFHPTDFSLDSHTALLHAVKLAAHPADLLVMATHQFGAFERWQHQAVAEPVARISHTPTLFVPTHVEGFVVKETGEPKLRRVLIPVMRSPIPRWPSI